VLKAHDLIVRSALTNYEGTEIKHTGDGIMVSFRKADKAVKAAIHIMKKVDGNNNSSPEYPLNIRIGMNAGEPIRQDNDLFGSSVQLAARVCDRAAADSIYMSSFVKDHLKDSTPFTYTDLGQHELKGFTDPQQLYRVEWQEAPSLQNDMESLPPSAAPIPPDPDFQKGLPDDQAESASSNTSST